MRNSKAKNLFLYAGPFALTALILTVIHPPFDLSPLAWVSMVPFILACSPDAKPRKLFLAAYIIGAAYWLAALYWVAPITILGWLAFCLYTGLLWPVLALSLRYCRARRIPLFFAAAVLIVGIERSQGLFLGGFPWRLLAHSQYRHLTIIQIADIFGAGGVSFLVAMVNGLLAELIITARSRKPSRPAQTVSAVLVVAAVVAAVLYGRWRLGQSETCIKEGPLVASVQSNVPQSLKRSFAASRDIFDEMMVESKAAAAEHPKLIVWPETMVQAVLNEDIWHVYREEFQDSWRALDDELKQHAKDNAYLLVGAYGADVCRGKQEPYLARYNSAFFYRPDGSKAPRRYDKIHLVPFSEALPFRRTFPQLYDLLKKFTPDELNYDYSLDYGYKYTIFEMPDPNAEACKFAVVICYEDVMPYVARKFALDEHGRKRIDFLVNISNDGWFVWFDEAKNVRPSTELGQHAAICVFRAVENRLPILRSVNTGISCLIDSTGVIRDAYQSGNLPRNALDRAGIAGWFADKMPIDIRTTFFSRHGQWLDVCCQIAVFIVLIVLFFERTRRKAKLRTSLSGRSNVQHNKTKHRK